MWRRLCDLSHCGVTITCTPKHELRVTLLWSETEWLQYPKRCDDFIITFLGWRLMLCLLAAGTIVKAVPSRIQLNHDDVIKWKNFPRYCPFVRGIHRSPVNSPHKGQWRGALMFFFYLCRDRRLSKHSWGWWFETPSCPLWRHCNARKGNPTLAKLPLKFNIV